MGALGFVNLQTHPTEVLDLTGLTLDEFRQLAPSFEAAFQAPMAQWRLDGKPRTARRCTTYKNCPLPPPEVGLLFLLVYLKSYSLQLVQGRLFGMGRSAAGDAARAGRCPAPVLDGAGEAPRRGRWKGCRLRLRYIYVTGTPKTIVPTPMINHTDDEFTMIEALMGRFAPFVDTYAPRY